METVLEQSMVKTTALQAYIAGDLFGDMKLDVQALSAFATELFAHEEKFSSHSFSPPLRENDGVPSVYVLHEPEVDPQESRSLGLVANMSDIMLARFTASDKLSGCFVGTADGNLLAVNDRAGVCLAEDGTALTLDVRNRPWYRQAAEAGELIFTGAELDSYTGIATLECAAPVYKDGELVCVVGADIFIAAINDYVLSASTDESFLVVINENGQALFSPAKDGTLKAEHSAVAADLRQSDNGSLSDVVRDSLSASTGLRTVTMDGREYYMTGAPMDTVGWAVIAVVDKELTHQPTAAMLKNYDEINDEATRIQADMLPNIFPAFPERIEFDVFATMVPAKEVGGDFYDFFLIDDMHVQGVYMIKRQFDVRVEPAEVKPLIGVEDSYVLKNYESVMAVCASCSASSTVAAAARAMKSRRIRIICSATKYMAGHVP